MLAVGAFAVSIALGMRMRAGFEALGPGQRMAVVAGLMAVPASAAFLKRLGAGRLHRAAVAALAMSLATTVWFCRPDESEVWDLLYVASCCSIPTLIAVAVQLLIVRLAISSES
jgi:hypothetical protein